MPEITDEMIEAGAMAIRDIVANRARGTRRQGLVWTALPATLRDSYRAEAKAAIEAALRCRCME